MRAPSLDKVCEWVTAAWSLITTDMIKKSFVSCGISAALVGADDESIVCLRPDEMAESCRSLASQTEALLAGTVTVPEAADDLDNDEDIENEGVVDLDGASDSDAES